MTKLHDMYSIPDGYSLLSEDLEHVRAHARDAWMELRGANIFITGATGFFGVWLLECLLWANEKESLGMNITALSRSPQDFWARAPQLRSREGLSFLQGSITDFEWSGAPVTHIIHAASENNVERRPDWAVRHIASALDGTRRLLDLARQHGTRAILVTTSGAGYTEMDRVVNGRCIEMPNGPADYASERVVYGQTKRMMEVLTAVAGHSSSCRALIARCFCFAGPYLPLNGNYAMGNFVRDGLARSEIVLEGDGTAIRSYLHAADLVVWLLMILTKGRSGVPYNVGGERAVSVAELARMVAEAAGMPGRVTIKTPPTPGKAPNIYLPDITRIKKDLGVDVNIELEDAIARTLGWYSVQQDCK